MDAVNDALCQVDLAAWPLVVLRTPAKLHAPAIESMFRGLDLALARKSKFVTLVDPTKLTSFPNAIERAQLAEHMKERTFAERTYNLGNGVVLASTAMRAVLTAIHWIRPPVVAHGFFGNFQDALEWCCVRLTEARIAQTPALESLRTRAARTQRNVGFPE